jgi:hypothetical protein
VTEEAKVVSENDEDEFSNGTVQIKCENGIAL